MRSRILTNLCTYGLLGTAAVVTFTLPSTLAPPTMMASPPPDTVTITSIIRDLRSAHADFNTTPEQGFGHYTGHIGTSIGIDIRPVLVTAVDDFMVSAGSLVPGERFSAQAAILGADVTGAPSDLPITVQVHRDAADIEPFGV